MPGTEPDTSSDRATLAVAWRMRHASAGGRARLAEWLLNLNLDLLLAARYRRAAKALALLDRLHREHGELAVGRAFAAATADAVWDQCFREDWISATRKLARLRAVHGQWCDSETRTALASALFHLASSQWGTDRQAENDQVLEELRGLLADNGEPGTARYLGMVLADAVLFGSAEDAWRQVEAPLEELRQLYRRWPLPGMAEWLAHGLHHQALRLGDQGASRHCELLLDELRALMLRHPGSETARPLALALREIARRADDAECALAARDEFRVIVERCGIEGLEDLVVAARHDWPRWHDTAPGT